MSIHSARLFCGPSEHVITVFLVSSQLHGNGRRGQGVIGDVQILDSGPELLVMQEQATDVGRIRQVDGRCVLSAQPGCWPMWRRCVWGWQWER